VNDSLIVVGSVGSGLVQAFVIVVEVVVVAVAVVEAVVAHPCPSWISRIRSSIST